jgi:phosphate acyltransferase
LTISISIDAMGGDYGPRVTVPGVVLALKNHIDLHVVMVGKEEVLRPLLNSQAREFSDRWSIVQASEEVEMDESPSQALRTKKDSSMRVAIDLLKEGKVAACVSSGNTGALMATARFVLKMLPGIDRPAIMARFPTIIPGKEVRVLDLGANVDSSAEQLYQFAVMGSIVTREIENIQRPTIGLLNIGEEEMKGNEQVKKTSELISQNRALNYIGYIEGNDIFSGALDVAVCDGFVGNVSLKICEGISKLIQHEIREAFTAKWTSKLAAMLVAPILTRIKSRVDLSRRNGAPLLGLNGIVIKSHGSAKRIAFSVAIEEAVREVKKNVPMRISEELSSVLEEKANE